ncbi:anti-sigma B factor RsbW [Ammoniphilus oxalaticus]|uniref:Anti-sigma B factor RsbW n=1 Tax=Ammoniphilus oxalaticus TaxID=66863 RepID=A0A419SFR4_9BACL|nr:anti-sigma B factor RsbW [Ammoniphilus oxalaticus]RKD22631.1 anti-sigma B factor RsbW [Ammoniphilus oxalaticus]
MKQQNKSVHLTIPAEADFVDVVRLSLYGIATKMGFSYEDIEDMKVAVSEACNNAVIHAYDKGNSGQIDVHFEEQKDGLRITIKDFGSSFNYEKVSNEAESLHDKELSEVTVGGLGIFMMQALMDDVQVNNETGTEVILIKLLNGTEGDKLYGFEETKGTV